MPAILANMKTGDVGTFDIPTPELRAGGILVRTAFSAISAGTEIYTIETGKKSLLGKAHARPDPHFRVRARHRNVRELPSSASQLARSGS
jgi:hypothetical protein